MIKAIITDVDGVIVGRKQDINFPIPNKTVLQRLNKVHDRGIPIILCTAKFGYAVYEIIKQADLRNPHITDGGALTIDLLSNEIVTKHVFGIPLAEEIISIFLKKDIYIECFGIEDYFVQKNQVKELTKIRKSILQKEQIKVASLLGQLQQTEIIKFIVIAEDEQDKSQIEEALKLFEDKIHFIWTTHPRLNPFSLGIITTKGVSKRSASIEVLKNLNISKDETLAIGDTLSDWNFMEICKYAGTVGDESQELKELVRKKGDGKFFYGSSVDEDGFIDILNFFKL